MTNEERLLSELGISNEYSDHSMKAILSYADEIRRECEEERNAYKDAAIAYQELSTCYRIGKSPNEKLFFRLEKARTAIIGKE